MSGSSKQQVMDEPSQDMAGLSGTHGAEEAEESGPPLPATAASIALQGDQEATIPAEEASGSGAQVESRKDVGPGQKKPLGKVAASPKKGSRKSKCKGKASLASPGPSSTGLGGTKRQGKAKAKKPEGEDRSSARKRQPAKSEKSSEAAKIEAEKADAAWNPMKKLFLVSILVVALLMIFAAVRPELL